MKFKMLEKNADVVFRSYITSGGIFVVEVNNIQIMFISDYDGSIHPCFVNEDNAAYLQSLGFEMVPATDDCYKLIIGD